MIAKAEWLAKKEEMNQIKREIANLCPEKMFAGKENQPKRSEEFEAGTLLSVKFPSVKGI